MPRIEKAVVESPPDEIRRLHGEIAEAARRSLQNAIRIGELLVQQKKLLPHGEFGPWVEANLPFTQRTATNYMNAYRKRDRLKSESVSDLTSAYRVLAKVGTAAPEVDDNKERNSSASTPEDADPLPTDRTVAFQIAGCSDPMSEAERLEFDNHVLYLMEKAFHTDSVKATVFEALRFAHKEHANA